MVEWPDYKHQDFPKYLGKRPDGSDVIAKNEAEEAEFQSQVLPGRVANAAPSPATPVVAKAGEAVKSSETLGRPVSQEGTASGDLLDKPVDQAKPKIILGTKS